MQLKRHDQDVSHFQNGPLEKERTCLDTCGDRDNA